MCALLFLQGAVEELLRLCTARSGARTYLSLAPIHAYYIHITFKTNTPPPTKKTKQNKHVNLGSVGHDAMQPLHNMCI